MTINKLIEAAIEAFNQYGDVSCKCVIVHGEPIDIIGFRTEADPETGEMIFKVVTKDKSES